MSQVFCKNCRHYKKFYYEISLSDCGHKPRIRVDPIKGEWADYYLCIIKNRGLNCEYFTQKESLWQKIKKAMGRNKDG